ncbi:MAG: restriction system protein [Acidobacteriota bacterium]|nr:restriction system protein [Acidobacteriota bacterium]
MWDYSCASTLLTLNCVTSKKCVWCNKKLLRMDPVGFQAEASQRKLIVQISICPYCGWWTVFRIFQGDHPRSAGLFECYEGAMGSLKEFDLTDISAPLSDVRNYLQIKRDKVFDLHPRIFEELVGSVFRDYGWEVRVTAYTGDGGIDIVLTDGMRTVGIQVKKHKKGKKVEAEQIRALAGALMLNGLTEGVFVTTSSYRRGAIKTAEKYTEIGHPIRLMDCQKFLDALEIVQPEQFNLDGKTFKNRVLAKGAYIGSGIEKPFIEKEDIYTRQIISSAYAVNELLDLHEEQVPHFAAEE